METNNTPTALDRLVAAYRALNPSSRVVSILRNVGSGTSKQYGCVLCGKEGPSYSGKYRETKRSIAWRETHIAAHVANVEAELIKLDAIAVGRTAEAQAIACDRPVTE